MKAFIAEISVLHCLPLFMLNQSFLTGSLQCLMSTQAFSLKLNRVTGPHHALFLMLNYNTSISYWGVLSFCLYVLVLLVPYHYFQVLQFLALFHSFLPHTSKQTMIPS